MSPVRTTITMSETLHVARAPQDVFDYTQDYDKRTEWDRSVTEARILGESPRRIRVAVRGVRRFTVAYQQLMRRVAHRSRPYRRARADRP